MEVIRSGLRYYVDHAAENTAIFGFVVVGLHLELLNRVDDWQDRVTAAEEELVNDAVQKEHVATVPLSVDRRDNESRYGQRQGRVETGATRIPLRSIHGCCARRERQQLREVTAVQRKFLNGFLRDDGTQFGGRLL